MPDFPGSITVYLAYGCADLRKSYTDLAAIIRLKFHLDPYSHCMLVFCSRRRTLLKILQWDGSEFWILMRRLGRDSLHWLDAPDELQKVTLKEIHRLYDGLFLSPNGALEECHPKIVIWARILSIRKKPKITSFWADFPPSRNAASYKNGILFLAYSLVEISES